MDFHRPEKQGIQSIPTEDLAGEVLRALKLQNSAPGNKCTNGNCRKLHKRGGAESASTCCGRAYNRNHPNHDPNKTDNSYVSTQFNPESFCENSMIMSADETCRKNGFTAEDLIALAVESHKNAANFIEVISPLTLPVVGLEKGRRNKAFNFSKDY